MIWLIGCNGMLGTEVASKLSERKIDFVGTGHEVDITEISALAEFAKGKNIDLIINYAGYTAVDKAETEPDLTKKINEIGTENIARLANQIHATLIHISTDYVFAGITVKPCCAENVVFY